MGDIHQPLHGAVRYNSGQGDEGGNLVKIKLPASMKKLFEGTQSKTAPTELHAFWDDLPGEGQPAQALPDAAAFAKPLPMAPDRDVADVDPSDWATESLALAREDAYAAPIGKGLHPTQASSSAYLITQAYYNTALQDAKTRIALAGARLSKLLTDNLD